MVTLPPLNRAFSVHTIAIPDSFSCRHEKLSGIVLTPACQQRSRLLHATALCSFVSLQTSPKSLFKNQKSSQDFLALIDSFDLKQHVCSPTHRAGHILDLLITRDDDQLFTSVSIHDAAFSDHFVVNCALSMEKPLFTKKQIIYRSFQNFDIDFSVTLEALPSSVIRQMNSMI